MNQKRILKKKFKKEKSKKSWSSKSVEENISVLNLKKKFKKTKSAKYWSPKSESENESIIKLKKKFKKAKGTKSWSPKGGSENESIENNDLTPSSVKLTTKKDVFITINEDKNEAIWTFIYKFIEDNSEELTILKDKYDTDDNFFRRLSELLIDKLSTQTRLFKNLHRNTIKALPKVIVAIYLLYFQKIVSITGDHLEKKSGMVGQYKKLRVIADHLGLELPFIMGDVVEKILDEKKEKIFKGEFYPSQENICKLDERLTPSRKMVKTISRWIQQNSDYKNLTELDNALYSKKDQKSNEGEDERFVILDYDTSLHKTKLKQICDTIISENPTIKYYTHIQRATGLWISNIINSKNRLKIKYDNFLKLQELYGKEISHIILIRRFHDEKWIFLYQDSDGNPISDEQALKLAADYLIEDVLKNNTSNYKMAYINDVLKRNDFISQLVARGLKFNDVVKEAGLEPNIEVDRWESFNWSLDGNPRSYDEALDNAAEYLNKLFVDYNYNFQTMQTSQTFLKKNDWDFLGALKRYNLDYYDVLTRAGFPNDKGRKKWKIIDADEKGVLYRPKEREKKIFQFFKDKILPIYEEKQLIENKIGPSYDEAIEALKNTDYHGFISAINRRGMSYGELLYSVGLSPRVTLNQKIGTSFHWIGEYIFMMHTRIDNDCISYYEAKIHDDDEHKPDNSVKVNKSFRDLSKEAKRVSENIKWVNTDYYLFHSSKRGIYKSDRGYQSEVSLLILNPLNIRSDIATTKKNIKILSVFNFCKFFGFSEERKREFIYFARLALQATNKDNTDALDELLQETERCKKELTSNPKINFKLK